MYMYINSKGHSRSSWPQKMFTNLIGMIHQVFNFHHFHIIILLFCVCQISIHCFIIELQYNQKQSWPSELLLYLISHKWVCKICFFFPNKIQNLLFCLNVSAGHFQQPFWALSIIMCLCVHIQDLLLWNQSYEAHCSWGRSGSIIQVFNLGPQRLLLVGSGLV